MRVLVTGARGLLGGGPAARPPARRPRAGRAGGGGSGGRARATESVAWALAAGRTLRLYADEYRPPVDPQSVASAIALLLAKGGAGRFHLGGDRKSTRLNSTH